MKRLTRFVCIFLFFSIFLIACGNEPKSVESVKAPENSASAPGPNASPAAVKETPLPVIDQKKPGDIPIKLREPDTAKMAAALREIESRNPVLSTSTSRKAGSSAFTGKWTLDKNIPGASFEVQITQWGQELRGSYCAVVRNGAKTDCITDVGEQYPAFRAPVPSGATVETEFTTYRENDKGRIKLSLENGKLHWVMTQEPKTECYAQRDAWMKKMK